MGDSYRDAVKKNKAKAWPRGQARVDRDPEEAEARSKALQRQQGSLAVRKGKALQRRLLDA